MSIFGLMLLLAAPAVATEDHPKKPMIIPDPDAGKELRTRPPLPVSPELPKRRSILSPSDETPYEVAKNAWRDERDQCVSRNKLCVDAPPLAADFAKIPQF